MDDILSSIKEFFKNRALVRKVLSLALSATGIIMLLFFSAAQLPFDNGRGRALELNLWALLFNFRDLRACFNNGEIFLFFFLCTSVELLVSGALIFLNLRAYSDESESFTTYAITVGGAIFCAALYILETIIFKSFFADMGMPPEMTIPSSSFMALIYALIMAGLLFYFALPKCSKCGKLKWSELTSLDDNLLCEDCKTAEDATEEKLVVTDEDLPPII